jgi:GT2 family glycosyltransferase
MCDQRSTLGRAIRSVLAQTRGGHVVIAVDNGSSGPAAVQRVIDETSDGRVRLVRLNDKTGTMLIRRDAFDTAGTFDPTLELRMALAQRTPSVMPGP